MWWWNSFDVFRYNWHLSYLLCDCFVFLHKSIRISIPWSFRICFHTKIVTFVKCNYRTHCNVSSSTFQIESLKFRNNSGITVTSLSSLLWKLWIWVFWILCFAIIFSLKAVLQGVAKNNPTKKEIDARQNWSIRQREN